MMDKVEKENTDFSRRGFLKTAAAATVVVAAGSVASANAKAAVPVNRNEIIAAFGDTLIPSDPGDPGYKDLEQYEITEEVLKALPGASDEDLELLNERSREKFGGKTFLDLAEAQRADYLLQIVDGSAVSDARELERLRRVYRNTRRRVFSVYYSNFPENQCPRDKNGYPILRPGDQHQITNPNTTLVTGWDQCGYIGPLTWEEEERRRNIVKKIHWHENWSPLEYKPKMPDKR